MTHINEYIESLKAEEKSDGTIRIYVNHIRIFFDFVKNPEEKVTKLDYVAFANANKDVSPSTMNVRMNAIKSYFSWLADNELIDVNPIAKVKAVKNGHPEKKEFVSREDISSMAEHADNPKYRAALVAFAGTGMRFSEMASITTTAYRKMLQNGKRSMTIIGKGDKARDVFFSDSVVDAINQYLTRSSSYSYSNNTDKLFGMKEEDFSAALKRYARAAGLSYADRISPHWLRSSFASNLLDAGVNVAYVRDALGHSSIQTTSRYIYTDHRKVQESVMSNF